MGLQTCVADAHWDLMEFQRRLLWRLNLREQYIIREYFPQMCFWHEPELSQYTEMMRVVSRLWSVS